MNYRTSLLLCVGALLLVSACVKDNVDEPEPKFQGFVVPPHFPEPVYSFEENEISQAGFDLGRKLFYDARLSRGEEISCGSCHAQVHAFSDHGLPISFGVEGREGVRNAPSISNLAWYPNFMWDGGINHIEVMPIAPLTAHAEMDMDLAELETYLANETEYPRYFESAFGDTAITSTRLLKALAQFQGSMVSSQSKYDKYLLGEASLNELQTQGMVLFQDNCASCHSGVLFTDFSFKNNGLDSVFTDQGRATITLDPEDLGKFRVPSLRNVRLTNPYMHDGRFVTLNQVVAHYANNVVSSNTLDPSLEGGIELSESEQEAIVEFLETLSDFEFISDLRFSEPIE